MHRRPRSSARVGSANLPGPREDRSHAAITQAWLNAWEHVTPFLALLLVPALGAIPVRSVAFAVFMAAATWSVAVQVLGVSTYSYADSWEQKGCDIDRAECRSRLWSVRDSQLVFLAGRLVGRLRRAASVS